MGVSVEVFTRPCVMGNAWTYNCTIELLSHFGRHEYPLCIRVVQGVIKFICPIVRLGQGVWLPFG